MNILVIDGQGGRLGQLLIERLKAAHLSETITAVGTNSAATASMLKAGAPQGLPAKMLLSSTAGGRMLSSVLWALSAPTLF